MEGTNILLAVMLAFAGALLLLLGYLTRKNPDLTGITLPNLDLAKIKDKKGFALLISTSLMLIGLCCFGTAAFVLILPQLTLTAFMVFIFLVIAVSFRLVIMHHKFENH
jgi:hypothetical protein